MVGPLDDQRRSVMTGELKLPMSHGDVELVPVIPPHFEQLYRIALSPSNAGRWRFHGSIPTPDDFVSTLSADTLVQFTVCVRSVPVGYVVAYAPNLRNRHVHVGGVFDEDHQRKGSGGAAFSLFIKYLFSSWDLRGVFAEVPEYVFSEVELGSSGRLGARLPFEVVGRRPDFHYQFGRYWDDYILYLPRRSFDEAPGQVGDAQH